MELKDWRGQPLNLGDIVIYRGKTGVVEGKIDAFEIHSSWRGDSVTSVKVIPNRRSDGYRSSANRVSINAKHITRIGTSPLTIRGGSI